MNSILIFNSLFQAELREEELGALKRKTDYLCQLANEQLKKEAKDLEDYYEIVSLAKRLNSVSEQLKGTVFD